MMIHIYVILDTTSRGRLTCLFWHSTELRACSICTHSDTSNLEFTESSYFFTCVFLVKTLWRTAVKELKNLATAHLGIDFQDSSPGSTYKYIHISVYVYIRICTYIDIYVHRVGLNRNGLPASRLRDKWQIRDGKRKSCLSPNWKFLPVQKSFVPAGPKCDVFWEGCDQKRHQLKKKIVCESVTSFPEMWQVWRVTFLVTEKVDKCDVTHPNLRREPGKKLGWDRPIYTSLSKTTWRSLCREKEFNTV